MVAKYNPNDFRPIETRHNGILYRSRLEARFALMFDTLRVRFEYESEGYETPFGRYLPDFWLPDVYMRDRAHKGVLVEVKPERWDEPRDVMWMEATATEDGITDEAIWQTNTEARLSYVAAQLGVSAMLVRGLNSDNDSWDEIAPMWDCPMLLYSCSGCAAVKFEFAEGNYMHCPLCKRKDYPGSSVRVARAAAAAASRRFW